MKAIVLMGLPGTGKSTIGKSIASLCGYAYISTGDIAREMKDKSWEKEGNLAPEDYIRDKFVQRVNEIVCCRYKGVVIDGMPRTIEQIYFISSIFPCIHYISLKASMETIFDRLNGRGRADDNEQTIMNRIKQSSDVIDEIESRVFNFYPYIRQDKITIKSTDDADVDNIINELLEVI